MSVFSISRVFFSLEASLSELGDLLRRSKHITMLTRCLAAVVGLCSLATTNGEMEVR